MKILQFYHNEDYGNEWVFVLLKGKKYSLIQFSFQWNDSSDFPYIQISSGNYNLLNILCWCWKVGFAIDILSRNWK